MNTKIRVLLADDNAQLRTRLSDALNAREEIEFCHCVSGGNQALSLLREKEYDVLLTDLILPQVDGFELLEEIRRMSAPPKVIILSALSQDDIIRRACSLGAYYYIIKPFDIAVPPRDRKRRDIHPLRDRTHHPCSRFCAGRARACQIPR